MRGPRPMKKPIYISIYTACLALALTACESSSEENAASTMPVDKLSVETINVELHDIPHIIKTHGSVEAKGSINISAPIGGTVDNTYFKEGSWVEKGALLFQLEQKERELDLKEALSRLKSKEAQLVILDKKWQRSSKLFEESLVASAELELIEAQREQLLQEIANDQTQVERAELRLKDTQIRAPISGKVGFSEAQKGSRIQTGQNLVSIVNAEEVFIDFNVSENHISSIQSALKEGALAVQVFPVNSDLAIATGVVSSMDHHVDSRSGTIRLKASVDNSALTLIPGQLVELSLTVSVQQNIVATPELVVKFGQEGYYVWVINEESKAEKRPVAVGARHENLIAIESGLNEGEKVVTAGFHLREGADVEEV